MTDYLPSATAEYSQRGNSHGIKYIVIFFAALFLFYAVQNHWINDVFVWLLSQFYEGFSIKIVSHTSDIVLLGIAAFLLTGVYYWVKFYFPLLITLGIAATIYGGLTRDGNPDKPIKLQSESKLEKSQHHFANYGD